MFGNNIDRSIFSRVGGSSEFYIYNYKWGRWYSTGMNSLESINMMYFPNKKVVYTELSEEEFDIILTMGELVS